MLEREHELKLNAEQARQQAREGSEAGNGHFNMSQAIRSVPVFQDHKVDMFFQVFEQVAKQLNWAQAKWALLTVSRCKGKAS